jgi:hypothetical protein
MATNLTPPGSANPRRRGDGGLQPALRRARARAVLVPGEELYNLNSVVDP